MVCIGTTSTSDPRSQMEVSGQCQAPATLCLVLSIGGGVSLRISPNASGWEKNFLCVKGIKP
jgi:hypothetical protein